MGKNNKSQKRPPIYFLIFAILLLSGLWPLAIVFGIYMFSGKNNKRVQDALEDLEKRITSTTYTDQTSSGNYNAQTYSRNRVSGLNAHEDCHNEIYGNTSDSSCKNDYTNDVDINERIEKHYGKESVYAQTSSNEKFIIRFGIIIIVAAIIYYLYDRNLLMPLLERLFEILD